MKFRIHVIALSLFCSLCFGPSIADVARKLTRPPPRNIETAVFAGGCFWSMQKAFDHVEGVSATRAGFIGGHLRNPTYQDVTTETTGHVEAVEVKFDPAQVSYATLLNTFWHNTDPTNPRGVICDFAPSYHTGIYTYNQNQMAQATASKTQIQAQLRKTIVTQIVDATRLPLPFYPADSYHQHYWRTHAFEYERYSMGCGRPAALRRLWGNAHQ